MVMESVGDSRFQSRILASRWIAVAPALIVVIPLIGLSLQGDERRRLYRSAHHYSGNPVKSAHSAIRNVDAYLNSGNFRPLGRFAEGLEHGLVFEASELTGMASHTILGLIRLFMVLVLALTSSRVVAALTRSAGVSRPQPVLALYPLGLGAVLVASGPAGPLAQFSFLFIGAVVIVLEIAIATARDQDMMVRPIRWHEPITMGLLGAATAMTYDIMYVAAMLALAYTAARAAASKMSFSSACRTAAARRWVALAVGFLAVLVPVRIEIARRCDLGSCYPGSEASLSADAVELMLSRALTATPVASWHHNASLAQDVGLELSLLDPLTTSLPVLLLAGIIALTALSAVGASVRTTATASFTRNTAAENAVGSADWRAWLRLAKALGSFGAVTIALPALTVSLARWTQDIQPDIGLAWRDTLMGQVGWSFVILAVLTALFPVMRSQTGTNAASAASAVLLGACLTLTMLANSRFAIIDRHDPISSVVNQIAAAAISADPTSNGNSRRCTLIDHYTELVSADLWIAGPGLRSDLDDLMVGRYGWPFCDTDRAAGIAQ